MLVNCTTIATICGVARCQVSFWIKRGILTPAPHGQDNRQKLIPLEQVRDAIVQKRIVVTAESAIPVIDQFLSREA